MTDGAGGIRGLTSEEAAEAGIGETVSSTYVRTQPLDGGVQGAGEAGRFAQAILYAAQVAQKWTQEYTGAKAGGGEA